MSNEQIEKAKEHGAIAVLAILENAAVHRCYVPQPVYLVERFDRRRSEEGWERLHCIDACQLLGLDRVYKYSEGSMARLSEISSLCRPSAMACVFRPIVTARFGTS